VRIPSVTLFEVLDAHGHTVDLTGTDCPTCPSALESGGYCRRCGVGYAGGRAYVTRFTYLLAKAEPVSPGDLACRACILHAADAGWCNRCHRGIMGTFAFRGRSAFDEAMALRTRLVRAVGIADRCELCAAAAFAGGRCPDHNIRFHDGKEMTDQTSTAHDTETP
jgi:hypothetical protein